MASHPRTPGELFGRHVLVDLGTEGATGVRLNDDPNVPQLRVAFRVEMTRSSDPHKATIRVWNPSPVTVGLMQAPRAAVRLFVGYDVPRLVFVGNPIRNGPFHEGVWQPAMDAMEKLDSEFARDQIE